MIPYSESEQKRLVEQLCRDIFAAAGRQKRTPNPIGSHIAPQSAVPSVHDNTPQAVQLPEQQPLLQLLFDLEFEHKFISLIRSIYLRLPAL